MSGGPFRLLRGVGAWNVVAPAFEVAQQSSISALVGLVLHENKPMLKMCRKLGFSIAPEPNDATVLRVRKSLAPVSSRKTAVRS